MKLTLRQLVLGSPLPVTAMERESLPKTKALAVFSSDALSSVAYATEEILLALVVVGPVVLSLSLPIALAITALLVIVAISYYQTIHGYPCGGGAYTVSRENLGRLRGVEVTLIVPARNDSLLVRYASVAHFDDLMSAGATIALFKGGLLHTNSMTIDGTMSVFGSVNLDMRSLWLDFEISLFVYDAAFTSQLRALQSTYLGNSDRLELDVWRRRPAWRRFTENTFRLLGPLL
ncbi:MAG: hypothetical protein KKB50_16445 [Planctomycetes bacterium]|nr:hypothetical protein [Planctomycetota bacterium]